MKIRTSFVSNSSSSSFIFKITQKKPCVVCGRGSESLFIKIIDLMQDNGSGECTKFGYITDWIKEEDEDIKMALEEEHEIDEERKIFLNKIKELAQKEDVFYCDISIHDDGMNKLYQEEKKIGLIEELWSTEE